jgi:5-methylcytosine-specific restriction endonuclease McrA
MSTKGSMTTTSSQRTFPANSRKTFYSTKEWFKVRGKVLRRDNFTCKFCGFHSMAKGMMVVDHVVPRMHRPDLAYAMTNLVTLCKHCHDSTKRIIEVNAHKPQISDDGFPPDWA